MRAEEKGRIVKRGSGRRQGVEVKTWKERKVEDREVERE